VKYDQTKQIVTVFTVLILLGGLAVWIARNANKPSSRVESDAGSQGSSEGRKAISELENRSGTAGLSKKDIEGILASYEEALGSKDEQAFQDVNVRSIALLNRSPELAFRVLRERVGTLPLNSKPRFTLLHLMQSLDFHESDRFDFFASEARRTIGARAMETKETNYIVQIVALNGVLGANVNSSKKVGEIVSWLKTGQFYLDQDAVMTAFDQFGTDADRENFLEFLKSARESSDESNSEN